MFSPVKVTLPDLVMLPVLNATISIAPDTLPLVRLAAMIISEEPPLALVVMSIRPVPVVVRGFESVREVSEVMLMLPDVLPMVP